MGKKLTTGAPPKRGPNPQGINVPFKVTNFVIKDFKGKNNGSTTTSKRSS
jgi:hypothetical protein